MDNNPNLKGYIPPFTGIQSCKYYKTGLCSLTGKGCHHDIQCYKEEIIESNKYNGNPDPNANVDRAIKDESERVFMVGDPGIDDDDDDDIDNYDIIDIIEKSVEKSVEKTIEDSKSSASMLRIGSSLILVFALFFKLLF